MQSKIIKISVLALSLAMLGGCANTSQLSEANAAAAAAMTKATEAYNLAMAGKKMTSDAASAAQQAQATADAALKCCKANSEKLDRMFEKAMMK